MLLASTIVLILALFFTGRCVVDIVAFTVTRHYKFLGMWIPATLWGIFFFLRQL